MITELGIRMESGSGTIEGGSLEDQARIEGGSMEDNVRIKQGSRKDQRMIMGRLIEDRGKIKG